MQCRINSSRINSTTVESILQLLESTRVTVESTVTLEIPPPPYFTHTHTKIMRTESPVLVKLQAVQSEQAILL